MTSDQYEMITSVGRDVFAVVVLCTLAQMALQAVVSMVYYVAIAFGVLAIVGAKYTGNDVMSWMESTGIKAYIMNQPVVISAMGYVS